VNLALVLAVLAGVGACAQKRPPVARPSPLEIGEEMPGGEATATRPPAPPEPTGPGARVPEPPEPVVTDDTAGLEARSIEELNRDSPLRPVFFAFDSMDIDDAGRQALDANAEVMRRNPAWVLTIEGHTDSRGTAEYNLSLGEKRALAARDYLESLGIPGKRFRTVSYGEEFPFDPGTTEEAFARNRRAHFVITAK
jgi:peptidoglycan-associated lipoprotein